MLAGATSVRPVVYHPSTRSQTSGIYKHTLSLEHHLASLRLQAFNYNAKQSRRWLRARLLSENRGFVTKEAGLQLATHIEKTGFQLQHPSITDIVLTANASWVLSQLEVERKAAREEQGYLEREQDR